MNALDIQNVRKMNDVLYRMRMAFWEWPSGVLGRMDYMSRADLRSLGRRMVYLGKQFIEEADRQDREDPLIKEDAA